jgi:tetratricopeptide (TPR) repeat protein
MNGLRIFIFFLFSIGLITKSKAQTFSDQEFSMISFVESLSSYGDYNSFSASRKNNIDSAVNWLNSVEYDERFNTYKVWFYYHRGRLVFVQKKIDLAKIDLEKAINLDTTNYDVMERICALSSHFKTYPTRKNFIKRGVAGYKHKLSIDSSKAEDWYYYALFMDLQSNYSSTHNIIKQRYALEKAVQLDSTDADYWYELSMCYYSVVDKKDILSRKGLTIPGNLFIPRAYHSNFDANCPRQSAKYQLSHRMHPTLHFKIFTVYRLFEKLLFSALGSLSGCGQYSTAKNWI